MKTIMRKCMGKGKILMDKPLVSILLAIYKPNERWFIEQLISINAQTYDNIELFVYDDCPQFPTSEEYLKKYITKFKYTLIRGVKNQGSNEAFEELTKVSIGDFFAYCDQDDIWEVNKIELLLDIIKKESSVLAYSDMSVIDKQGKTIAKTLIEKKPRITYIYGEDLFHKFFFKNCVSGCCMLVNSKVAKMAIPFSKVTIHDQWICMIASTCGNISFLDKPLVRYRMHGNNQTQSLKGVYDKKNYYIMRTNILEKRLNEIKETFNNIELNDVEMFCKARIDKKIINIFKYRYLNKKEAYFEIAIKYMPNWIFKLIIGKLKN